MSARTLFGISLNGKSMPANIQRRVAEIEDMSTRIEHCSRLAYNDMVKSVGGDRGVLRVRAGKDEDVVGVYVHGANSLDDAIRMIQEEKEKDVAGTT